MKRISPAVARLVVFLSFLFFALWSTVYAQTGAAIPTVEVQTGHRQVVNLVFSPDGKLLASGGAGDAIKVWEIATGQMRFVLPYSGGLGGSTARNLIFTPDSQTLIVVGHAITLWDVATGKLERSLPLHLLQNERGQQITQHITVVHSALRSDGGLLACATRAREVILVDLASGNRLKILTGSPGFINALSFSADGKRIMAGSAARCWCVWDVDTGARVGGQFVTANGNGNAVGYASSFSPGGDSFVCAGTSGRLRRWDTFTGREFGAYVQMAAQTESSIRSVAFNNDGTKLAGIGATLNVWQAHTGQVLLTLPGEHATRDVVAFHPTDDLIAVGNAYTIELWGIASRRKLRTLGVQNPPVVAAAFRPDGRSFALAAENQVVVQETATGRRLFRVRDDRKDENVAPLRSAVCTAFSPDSRLLAVGGVSIAAETVLLVDANTGKRVQTLHLARDYEPGQRDYSANAYGQSYPPYRVTVGALAFSPDSTLLVTASSFAARPRDFGPFALTLWEVKTGRCVRNITIPRFIPRRGMVEGGEPMRAVSFTPDGKSLLAAGHLFRVEDGTDEGTVPGYEESRDYYTRVPVVDTAGLFLQSPNGARLFLKNQLVARGTGQEQPLTPNPISALTFARDDHTLAFADTPPPSESSEEIALSGGRIGLIGPDTTEPRFLTGHTGKITALAFSPDGKYLLSGGEDGTARLWDVRTAREAIRFYLLDEDDYVALTSDSYYLATRRAVRYINRRDESGAVPIGQFDLRLNRPDVVLQRLGYAPAGLVNAYHTAWLKRLARQNFTPEMLASDIPVPEVQLDYRRLPLTTHDTVITVPVHAQDGQYRLARLRVFVNDVPMGKGAGIDLSARKARVVDLPLKIVLNAGRNRVQISVVNEKGAESFYQTFEVYQSNPPPEPDLYVLTIGVSRYKDTSHSLAFAAKDARDMAAFFAAQASASSFTPTVAVGKPKKKGKSTTSPIAARTGRYGHVLTRSLLDADVTLERIAAARTFLAQAREQDVVIVFIAGHGGLDSEYNYIFGTYDIDFRNPARRGLNYSGLEDLLDGIPSRSKLLLMDTCHAGETDRYAVTAAQPALPSVTPTAIAPPGELGRGVVEIATRGIDFSSVAAPDSAVELGDSFALMQDMFTDFNRGSGAAVIGAAGGAQYAFEREGQGVFTGCLLEGLKTRAADANRDGHITLSELRDYVTAQVNDRTGGRQVPTARRESLEFDFEIL